MRSLSDDTPLMVNISATATLVAATAVFIIWRLLTWRRHGVRPVRELVVVTLFLWSLVLVSVTFFPMRIVLYDWYGSANLVPFASILQLVTETPLQVATLNIVGNVILFLPFGFLLPLLYPGVATIGGVAGRAAVVSIVIELLQVVTRSRATDVDDVILNTLGAVVGFAFFWLSRKLLGRRGAAPLVRIGAEDPREPLLDARWPVGLSILLAIPLIAIPFLGSTIGEGRDGIEADAISRAGGGEVVQRGVVQNHTLLLVESGGSLTAVDYEQVVPGRYTWVGVIGPIDSNRPSFTWTVPAFNPSEDEEPLVLVFGQNEVGAVSIRIIGNGLDARLALDGGLYFVTGIPFSHDVEAGRLDDFVFEFSGVDGVELTDEFQNGR